MHQPTDTNPYHTPAAAALTIFLFLLGLALLYIATH